MNKDKISNEDIFECKMYITDLETNKKSKEINVSDLVFNDYIEFEFGNYEDEDYGTLPYKDFKFFINDYSITFYSPQYHKAKQELERYKNIIKLLKHFGENALGIIYALKDNVEPTENEWLNLIEYEKYLRELKGE